MPCPHERLDTTTTTHLFRNLATKEMRGLVVELGVGCPECGAFFAPAYVDGEGNIEMQPLDPRSLAAVAVDRLPESAAIAELPDASPAPPADLPEPEPDLDRLIEEADERMAVGDYSR